jgi:fructuronate reductase
MSFKRLSQAMLGDLPDRVARPLYDRSRLQTGIVHLGVGAFHRAHQAVYTEQVLRAGDLRWGILGVSLRSPATRDALRDQDGLYSVCTRDGSGESLQVIGALCKILVGPENPAALVSAMAQPSVKIISLTTTEKGYCHDPATGRLRDDDPDICHDVSHPDNPRTALGLILAALEKRRAEHIPAFTVISCDNLPSNGRTLKRVLMEFAHLRDQELARFVGDTLTCPCTMVDRIVPATTEEDRTSIANQLQLQDAWPVVTEPFTQWVIEDNFNQERPNWEDHGAELTADVAPYELMKLRLLNGAHSCIAYLGYLCGYETVAQSMGDPSMRQFVVRLMDEEVTPVLVPPARADVSRYKQDLIERFSNPALHHRTWQIAMDGSQKLPQRWLGTVRARLAENRSVFLLALGIAAWMRYVSGVDESGKPINVRDPLAAELRRLADQAGLVANRLAPALLSVEAIFGTDLPSDPRFTGPVTLALDRLISWGAKRTLRHVLNELNDSTLT